MRHSHLESSREGHVPGQDCRPVSQLRYSGYPRYLHDNGFSLALIVAVAWCANYVRFASFGLYGDDWFYVGYPFLTNVRTWLGPVLWQSVVGSAQVGRPLQAVFGFVFAEAGVVAKTLAADYLVSFSLFAASALLMYAVLRRRFSVLISTLATLLFVITPLHTLRQFLNGEFSIAPAFILVFGAMLLYLDGKRVRSYALAFLSILCYESIFFLFMGAPLLRRSGRRQDRRREWPVHLAVCGALVVCYFVCRSLSAEKRAAALHSGPALIWAVLHAWVFQTCASFASYLYAFLNAWGASLEAWVYAVPFGVVLIVFLRSRRQPKPVRAGLSRKTLVWIARSAAVGFLFLILGYVLSYFFFQETTPHLHFVDRDSRISVAASFGSSVVVAVLLAGWIRLSRTRTTRLIAYSGVTVFLTVLFLYSFVVQDDYVNDWTEQREIAQQVIALTPDAKRDSIIVLQLLEVDSGIFSGVRPRAIGRETFIYETVFSSLYGRGQPWPTLFVVHSDEWHQYLQRDADGFIVWSQPQVPGRWNACEGRFLPGRFIVLEEIDPGRLIRRSEPILVNGVQILQVPPSTREQAPLWATVTPSPLLSTFLPDFAWKSANGSPGGNPRLLSPPPDTVLRAPRVRFAWTAVAGAQDYWIDVGTGPAKGDLFGGYTKGATSIDVDVSKWLNGAPIYVQLYSKFEGADLVPGAQFRFSTSNAPGSNPQLVSPAPNSVISDRQVTFAWTAVPEARNYWIDVGSAPAKGDIFCGFTQGATWAKVDLSNHLSGGPIYVQLYSKFLGLDLFRGTGAQFQFRTTPTH
jgi:hypothetical protein